MDRDTFNRIVKVLMPHFDTEADRRAVVTAALYSETVLDHIVWSGNPHTFTVNLVRKLKVGSILIEAPTPFLTQSLYNP